MSTGSIEDEAVQKMSALTSEQVSAEARTAEGVMLSKMLDEFAHRLHTLYDIGKALPAPLDALGSTAKTLLHDYVNMAFAFRRYVERDAAPKPHDSETGEKS